MASGSCTSCVRQNYHPDCEKALNEMIGLELGAMYTYISMSSHFDRSDKALDGFRQYFNKSMQEEMGHVDLLCKYQSKRGGNALFKDIKKPEKDNWGSGLDAMRSALDLEKEGYDQLLHLHKVADEHSDYDLANFLEQHFLGEVVGTIKELGGHITNLQRVGTGHGEYHFDRNIK